MRKLFHSLFLQTGLLVAASFPTFVASAPAGGWAKHVGAHYSVQSWAGILRTHQYGTQVGDFVPLTSSQLSTIDGYPASQDLVLVIGGLGSAREADIVDLYMDGVEADNGEAWKENVRSRVAEVAEAMEGRRVVWQIGNEITSAIYSENLHGWANDGGTIEAYDLSTIPLYVEYYFAPTVEAIHDVASSSRKRLPIALGSITNYSNQDAQDWLDSVLDYEIEGTFAPSLAGKKVYELVNVITLHYFMGGNSWSERLDHLYETWYRKGGIRAVWSTEEVGGKAADVGHGAAASLRVLARGLSWWGPRQFPGRAIFWGQDLGEEGTRVSDALSVLEELVPPDKYLSVTSVDYNEFGSDSSAIESYRFAVGDSSQTIMFVVANNAELITIDRISVPEGNISAARAFTFGDEGYQELNVGIETNSGLSDITFAEPTSVSKFNTLLMSYEAD